MSSRFAVLRWCRPALVAVCTYSMYRSAVLAQQHSCKTRPADALPRASSKSSCYNCTRLPRKKPTQQVNKPSARSRLQCTADEHDCVLQSSGTLQTYYISAVRLQTLPNKVQCAARLICGRFVAYSTQTAHAGSVASIRNIITSSGCRPKFCSALARKKPLWRLQLGMGGSWEFRLQAFVLWTAFFLCSVVSLKRVGVIDKLNGSNIGWLAVWGLWNAAHVLLCLLGLLHTSWYACS